jgi:adenine deaminase
MLKNIIFAAKGVEKADLILKNLNIVNVLSGIIEKGDIAIKDGIIAGIGDYDSGESVIDCRGAYAMPGFIDSHAHIESTHLTPSEFAYAVVPCGTTAVMADPHEIANVCGIDGIKYIYNESKKLPLDVHIMFPSCVPATDFETSGARLSAQDMKKNGRLFYGLGEFMNYPGVINADGEAIDKINSANKGGKIIDGHCPTLSGKDLNAYIAAGIKTDHECISAEEMLEKINRGMYVQLREGSAAKNLKELVKGLNPRNIKRCLFCTDDKTPYDILTAGHIDNNIRLAMKCGLSLIDAVTIATLNAAQCYGLKNKGAIAPSYSADIVICKDIDNFIISEVYKGGKLVAKDGKPFFKVKPMVPSAVLNTVNAPFVTPEMLEIKLNTDKAKVIKLIEKSIVTEKVIRKVNIKDGCFVPEGGLVKIAVIERHRSSGNIGLGILEGYGIKGGAVAVSVAHDSHNIIAAGDNDKDVAAAVNELRMCGGGITVVKSGKAQTLSLEIAGLISRKTAAEFSREYSGLCETAYSAGVNKNIEPFMSLSFISLPVIPHLKITDKGLFDVDAFSFTKTEA